jgi:hypothetical protein
VRLYSRRVNEWTGPPRAWRSLEKHCGLWLCHVPLAKLPALASAALHLHHCANDCCAVLFAGIIIESRV